MRRRIKRDDEAAVDFMDEVRNGRISHKWIKAIQDRKNNPGILKELRNMKIDGKAVDIQLNEDEYDEIDNIPIK